MLYLKSDFADVVKITNQLTLKEGDYPGLSGWAQCEPRSLHMQRFLLVGGAGGSQRDSSVKRTQHAVASLKMQGPGRRHRAASRS